jgi:hypothetical protein
MYEAKEKSIDGHKVTVSQWPARKALAIKLKLIRAVGPSLGELVSSARGDNLNAALDSNMNMDRLGSALERLLGALDEVTFMALTSDLMSGVRVDDLEMADDNNFNATFTGHLETFYKIVWFVLEVNFGSFFGESGIGKLTESVKGLMTKSSPMPQKGSRKKSGRSN